MPSAKTNETTTNVAEENTIKKNLSSALYTKLNQFISETDFKKFIIEFKKAMLFNETIAKNEKNYGFEKNFNPSYKIDKPKNKSETEMLFYQIRFALDKLYENITEENVKLLTTALDAVSAFNKNCKALICQGNLKGTFGTLKTKTESLWKTSELNPANKTQPK